jgi:hypothetical protein
VIKRLSYLLFWLTMLALPFGSPAAAAVPPCHHAQAMVHVAGMQKAEAPAATHARSCATHDRGRHASCSSCPGCCAGVALAPPPLPALPDAGPAFVAIPFRAGHMPSVDPALLERPPRASFA